MVLATTKAAAGGSLTAVARSGSKSTRLALLASPMALMAWSMPPLMVPMCSSQARPASPRSARVMAAVSPLARATASRLATTSADEEETPAPAGTAPSTMRSSASGSRGSRPLARAASKAPL